MAEPKLEQCAFCDTPTGRAGASDDSLYCGTIGPFCDDCYSEANVEVERLKEHADDRYTDEITDLKVEVERLRYVKEENSWLCKQHSEDERDMELLREDKAVLKAQNDDLAATILKATREQTGEAGSRERTAPAAAESSGSASPVESPVCPHCGQRGAGHFVPTSMGEPGYYICGSGRQGSIATHHDDSDAKE